MNSKINEIPESPKRFIPSQVGAHNKAIDLLTLLRACEFKIKNLKKQIENVDADLSIMPDCFADEHREVRNELVRLHDRKVMVYRRIMKSYRDLLISVCEETLSHTMPTYPVSQPAALENGQAA